jgi:hypothetical protein
MESNNKNYWFSSDFHIGHTNILKYDNRPFSSIEEHDATLLKRYNNLVDAKDDFYFLGDFALGCHPNKVYATISQMNGNKFFIKGNHDRKETVKAYEKYGTFLNGYAEIEIERQRIILCHYPLRCWNGSNKNSIHLYGHCHGSIEKFPNGKSMDVGINLNNYYPFNFNDIMQIMNKRQKFCLDIP